MKTKWNVLKEANGEKNSFNFPTYEEAYYFMCSDMKEEAEKHNVDEYDDEGFYIENCYGFINTQIKTDEYFSDGYAIEYTIAKE